MVEKGKFEVIPNPNKIKNKVREVPERRLSTLLDQADRAVQALSGTFLESFKVAVEQAEGHMAAARVDPTAVPEEIRAVRGVLHELRGQAGTFGFGLVSEISDSACKFVEFSPALAAAELVVLQVHVDALKVIHQQGIEGEGGEIGRVLMEGLRAVIRKQAGSQVEAG